MTNDRGLDERLDRAIDRAVRQIMSADPPAGLRRRVLAQLDDQPRPSGGIFTWRRTTFGLAAAAAVVLALVMIPRDIPSDQPAEPIPAGSGTVAQTPARVGTEPTARADPPATDPRGERRPAPAPATRGGFRPSRERIALPPVANVFGAPSERVAATNLDTSAESVASETAAAPGGLSIAPLAPPAPIVVTPLTTAPLVVPRIEIVPIEVRRIQPPASGPR